MSGTSLLWLRRDLRLHDHPALQAARAGADHLVPVFCFDDRLLHGRHASGPRTQFLLECLTDLDRSLRARGSRLVVRHGPPEVEIPRLAKQTGRRRIGGSRRHQGLFGQGAAAYPPKNVVGGHVEARLRGEISRVHRAGLGRLSMRGDWGRLAGHAGCIR